MSAICRQVLLAALRTCSKSFEHKIQEGEMDELQAGIQPLDEPPHGRAYLTPGPFNAELVGK